MKYLAIIDDSMLSNFRRDDDGRTMVVTDKNGASRGIILHPVFEAKPMVIFNGKVAYLNQDCAQLLFDFEHQKLIEEHLRSIEASFANVVIDESRTKQQTSEPGQWIERVYISDHCSAECSYCGRRSPGKAHNTGWGWTYSFYEHCPNCGKKMREAE